MTVPAEWANHHSRIRFTEPISKPTVSRAGGIRPESVPDGKHSPRTKTRGTLLDRLTRDVHILGMNGESFRSAPG